MTDIREINPVNESYRVVAGVFPDRLHAEEAIRQLKAIGIADGDIGVAMLDRDEQGQLIDHTNAHKTVDAPASIVEGGLIGGLVGMIVGIGVLSVPGVGPIIAGGILASTLAGAGIGSTARTIHRALLDLGTSADQANYLETQVNAGYPLVTVKAEGHVRDALDIYARNGADFGDENLTEFEAATEVEENEHVQTAGSGF